MPNTTIEQLELQVQSSSTSAEKGIDALSASLSKLKGAIKGGVGLNAVATQLNNINAALNGMSGDSPQKLSKLADSLQKLSNIGNLKISSSISNQIRNIGSAVSSLDGVSFSNIRDLASALAPLSNLGNNLTSFVTQLKKIPEVVKALDATTISQFSAKIQQLVSALSPLATQLNTISNAFSRLPAQIRQTTTATNALNTANNTASKGYMNLWAKARMAYNVIRGASHLIASCITESNRYIENINLFTASMGEYAEEAQRYAEKVGEVMGIDPGQFMRYQGTFMTITKGFGVAADKAALMSRNLTQLGYDLASLENESFDVAMQKIESGIAGELEPLRRWGYDLSVARLQQEALNLGITKRVNAMTQAEKAQLRYYAIMTQVTWAQGDMARTLNAPANQLRILSQQVQLCAREFGNVFLPILNNVLPYLIAFAKVLRMVINLIGKFVDFELPEIDYSSIAPGSDAIGDLADNTNDATNAAKKLKNAITGIDELNIISDNDNGTAGTGSGLGVSGGDLGIELPEYNFLEDAITTKVDELVTKFKEWAGLTDDIDTWAEFFHTKLGRIFILVGEIAAGFALWKLSKTFLDGMNWLHILMSNGLGNTVAVTTGIVLTITGLVIEWTGIKSIIEDGIDKLNLGETIGGAIMTSIGGVFIGTGAASFLEKAGITSTAIQGGMGSALAGVLFSGGIAAVVAGIPSFVIGIYSSIKEGLSLLSGFLTEFGATLTGIGAGAIGAALGAWGGPIGIAVGALIGIVVGALTNLGIYLAQNWDDVKAWIGKVGGAIKTFFTETVPGFFKNLPEKIKEAWNKVIQPIKDFDWKKFGYDCGKKVGEAVKKICDSLKKFFTDTLPEVWEKVKESFNTFFTQTLPKFFTETIPEFYETVKEGLITFFTETFPEALSDIGDWFVDVGQSIWDGIKEGWDTAVESISSFIDGFVQGFKDALGINSPSTIFRDQIGKFLGEGILDGVLLPFNKLGEWVKTNIIDPITKAIDKNPIEMGISLIKKGWTSVKEWIGNIPVLSQAIRLLKNGWTTVKNWIGNIPTLSQMISLLKSGWTTVKNWIGALPVINQAIGLIKRGWTTISKFIGATSSVAISLIKDGWSSISSWIGTKVSVGISLFKDGWSSIKSFFGLSNGGIVGAGGGVKMFAGGGIISSNSFWSTISKYAGGTTKPHGSLFVAGENGEEMVGHVNGTTEVLNRFQLAQVMYSSIVSGMNQFGGYFNRLNSHLSNCTNAVIRTILTEVEVLNANYARQMSYDPTNALSQTVYDDSSAARRNSEGSIYADMRDFYKDYVEPTLREIANDTKRQADKEEQTIVQIGNRTITDTVKRQQNANGYKFATT